MEDPEFGLDCESEEDHATATRPSSSLPPPLQPLPLILPIPPRPSPVDFKGATELFRKRKEKGCFAFICQSLELSSIDLLTATGEKEKGENTLLHYAVREEPPPTEKEELIQLVIWMVENGSDVNQQNAAGETVLHACAEQGLPEVST